MARGAIKEYSVAMRFLAIALLLGVFPAAAAAQALPQSTLDRQQIGQLQTQLTNPSISPTDRLHTNEQIAKLQYDINTRSPIAEMTPAGPSNGAAIDTNRADRLIYENSTTGSQEQCAADRVAIDYLRWSETDQTLSFEERRYAAPRISILEADLRRMHC